MNYCWNGPGSLSTGGKLVKQGELIPQPVIETLSEKQEGQKMSQFEKYTKLKTISKVEAPEEETKELKDMTEEEIEKSQSKKDLLDTATGLGIDVKADDNKPEIAALIHNHFHGE